MNNLEVEIRMVKVIRKVLSILMIISVVSWFIGHYTNLSAFDIVYSVFMLGAGIIFLSGKIETDKISLRTNDISVFIKWVGMIGEKQLLFADIDRICLKKSGVEIERKGNIKMKYNLDNLEVWQKKEVYDYFIRFAKEKEIVIERHFETK